MRSSEKSILKRATLQHIPEIGLLNTEVFEIQSKS
jgi:hypothetical protein